MNIINVLVSKSSSYIFGQEVVFLPNFNLKHHLKFIVNLIGTRNLEKYEKVEGELLSNIVASCGQGSIDRQLS